MYGDAMEAFIGAIYLDLGYAFCYDFATRIVVSHHNLNQLIEEDNNFKSQILQWGQKNNHKIEYQTQIVSNNGLKEFKSDILVDGKKAEEGFGNTKKKSEQDASRKALEHI